MPDTRDDKQQKARSSVPATMKPPAGPVNLPRSSRSLSSGASRSPSNSPSGNVPPKKKKPKPQKPAEISTTEEDKFYTPEDTGTPVKNSLSTDIVVSPNGQMPSLNCSHRPLDACPCGNSIPDTWMIDCSKCKQNWHVDCLSLKGLEGDAINKLVDYLCPLCYISPIPTKSPSYDVDLCHLCRNTAVLQKTNNLYELSLAEENTSKMVSVVESIVECTAETLTSNNLASIQSTFDSNTAALKSIVESSENALKENQKLVSSLTQQLNDISAKLQQTTPSTRSTVNGDTVLPGYLGTSNSIDPCCEPAVKDYIPDLLSEDEALGITAFLEKCRENGDFQQKNGRQTMAFGVPSQWVSIYNDGPTSKAIPKELEQLVTEATSKCSLPAGQELNVILVNYYPAKSGASDPASHIPAHSDNEFDILPESTIATYSLGATRQISLIPIHNDEETKLDLESNSLYLMSRESQAYFKHTILDVAETAPRYSLTMRCVNPAYERSTLLVGDSNTKGVLFGEGRGTMGERYPGKRVKAGRIKDVNPTMCVAYSNIVLMVGTNDLRPEYRPNVTELARVYTQKISDIVSLNPRARVLVMPVLPTRDAEMNTLVMAFNRLVFRWFSSFKERHPYLNMPCVESFLDNRGLLSSSLTRNASDLIHLGDKGIAKLVRLVKDELYTLIVKQRKVSKTARPGPKKPG